MNTHTNTLHCIAFSAVAFLTVLATGCGKKEPVPVAPPPPTEPAKPAAPAQPATPPAPVTSVPPATAPVPKPDPLKSMVDSATKATDSAAKQASEMTAPSAPTTATPQAPAAAPQVPASLQSGLPATQTDINTAAQGMGANLSASAVALQQQAEELLTRYSGELATLKSGAVALKSYVDQHPDILPASAKASYQQFNAMVPQLESMVGTLKDYKNADLTTLVPKLQGDFAKAKSLYSEVRALLPATL